MKQVGPDYQVEIKCKINLSKCFFICRKLLKILKIIIPGWFTPEVCKTQLAVSRQVIVQKCVKLHVTNTFRQVVHFLFD